ncbi:MAG TPA: Fis family transcriptional regulator [Alphaproteobacteria bacterium]|nr:Fis family transcriptional regulator [Alphaproteobacteria bacterium]
MKTKKHPNEGSSLEDFLQEDGNLDAATLIAVKRVIAWQIEEAMKKNKLTKSAMAARMKTSRNQLDRVLNPDDDNVTIETLQRAAKAVGRSLRLELS